MHKTFISYHHQGEQDIKNEIIEKFGGDDFIDKSVSDGDIDPDLNEETIMSKIRSEYLYNSTVTLVLVGIETSQRPFVNSEIQASLRDTHSNKHNGLLCVIRDEVYEMIYSNSTCGGCGASIRTRDNTLWDYYVPDLVKQNHQYHGDRCHYNSQDVYCAILRYSTFLADPERYINEAFDKREDDSFEIKKTLRAGIPRIGRA